MQQQAATVPDPVRDPIRDSVRDPVRTQSGTLRSNGVPWLPLALLCLPLLAWRIVMFTLRAPQGDFITYWAAGHLFLTHGDPFSPAATFAIEKSYGWTLPQPYVTFCPPWALPIMSVMALLTFHAAHSLWFAISLVLNATSAIALWSYFGGESRKSWIAILLCLTFLPMGGAELLGQITPLILFSLTAFLWLLRRDCYFAAGFVLIGVGPKPHLLFLVALAILFWTIQKRAWTLLVGAAVSYSIFTAAAFTYNPASLGYLHETYGAAMDISCGIGGALRSVFGLQHLWLQFLPSVIGAAWFLFYWAKHRHHWDWQEHLPLLLIVSVCTSPYCWYHDFILILPALVALAVRGAYRSGTLLAVYLLLQAVIIVTVQWSVAWMCVFSLAWIVLYRFAVASRSSVPTTPPGNAPPDTLSTLPVQ
jgi:Glycosyltransferase family 87